jgi:hypothetical protein
MRTTLSLTGIALACTLTLAGCTPVPHPALNTRTSAAHSTEAPDLPSGVAQATNVPTSVPNDPAQRKNVTITDCSRTDDGWKAAGTATNPGNHPASYELTVFFTAAAATVLAVGDAIVTVDPGATSDWRVDGDFAAPEGTRCVLSGVAAQ